MKLAHPVLNQPIRWNDTYINTFVVENPIMYRNFLKELYDQEKGQQGSFVLSVGDIIVDFGKNTEIINDVLKIDTSSNKKIISAIAKEINDIMIHDMYNDIHNIYISLNGAIANAIFSSGKDLIFDDINDISQIVKLYNVRPDDENLSLEEKIIFHMELCEKYLHKKLFVFLNLHSYFHKDQLESLFRDIIYRKYNVLIVERYDIKALINEQKQIIDMDLCEI